MKNEVSNNAIKPDYYKKYKIDPLTFIMENNLDFVQGCIIKYIMRYRDKNGVEDLRKIIEYVERLIKKIEQDNVEFLPVCYDFFNHDFEEETIKDRRGGLEDKEVLNDFWDNDDNKKINVNFLESPAETETPKKECDLFKSFSTSCKNEDKEDTAIQKKDKKSKRPSSLRG